MTRLLAPLLALSLSPLALAGCGDDGASGSPLENALSLFPADAPVVVAVETDPGRYRDAQRIVEKFPFGDRVKRELRDSVERGGTDYEKDVKPLLGNPLVFGVPDTRGLRGDTRDELVLAFEAQDSGKLEDLVKRDAEKAGEKEGATLYEDEDGDTIAVDGDLAVFAEERHDVEQALERRAGDDHLDEDAFERGLGEVPSGLLRLYVNAEAILRESPRAVQARRVKWVEALRTVGLSASAKGDDVEVEFELRTEPGNLTDADLPLAPGTGAAPVVERAGEVSVGLRDPSQIVDFSEGVARVVDPRGYADFQTAKRQIEERLGVSVDDLVGQLEGDTSVSASPAGEVAVRAELEDPARFERTLARVARLIPRLAGDRGVTVRKRGTLYFATDADGDQVVFGVVDDVFAAGTDARRVRRVAAASPRTVPGSEGSVALAADAERLADAVLPRVGDRIGPGAALFGPLFTAPLGDLSGSIRTDKGGMRGRFRLTVD